MNARNDRAFIKDILARIELIAEFTAAGQDAFNESKMVQEAVIRSLEVIGEACRNLSDDIREQNEAIPWRQIIAFRNFAIHAYWNIKIERVWQIVATDLPLLQEQLATLLITMESGEEDNGESE